MKSFPFVRSFGLSLVAAIFGVFMFISCKTEEAPKAKNIVETALADPQFTTLVAALQKAELTGTLSGTGPFTVFAPNNAAFVKAGVTDLSKISKEDLSKILLDHVLGANVLAANVMSGKATTAGTRDIYLSKNASGVFINGKIKVTTADVPTANGTIHIIDDVIMQPTQNIVQIAMANPNFKTLVSLVNQADLGATLSGGAYTVFAPTDAAFTELFKTVDPATLTKKQISDILLYHVLPGRVFSTDLVNGASVQTALMTGKVTIDLSSGAGIKATAGAVSKVSSADLLATNGVIHVIDKVLIP
ncbi:MAG: fasciclin domain-containing protein [Cytophagia bacterium]|nr:MAG: fasciclin domain-containing protein [Cytophagales bacterium]TAG43149.1 MAG: fasciclin domain-containing protein [Cytophagia bacterium]TAG76534.1 MAG: fasciclin domain-containing protein [Cytophagales bacterium]